jgi:hypothetical protein
LLRNVVGSRAFPEFATKSTGLVVLYAADSSRPRCIGSPVPTTPGDLNARPESRG